MLTFCRSNRMAMLMVFCFLFQLSPSLRAEAIKLTLRATDPFPSEIPFELNTPIAKGDWIRIKAGGTWALMNLRIENLLLNGQPMEVGHRFDMDVMVKDWNWHIQTMPMITVQAPQDLTSGTRLVARVSVIPPKHLEDPANLVANHYSGITWTLSPLRVADLRAVKGDPVGEPLAIDFVSGPPVLLSASLKKDGRLMLTWYDKLGNPTPPDSDTVKVQHSTQTIELPADKTSPVAIKTSIKDLETGSRVEVSDGQGRTARSNALPVALDGTSIHFGEFHWHTEFSGDGQRSLEAAMRSARDEMALDFVGPGDHIGLLGEFTRKRGVLDQGKICEPFEQPGIFSIIAGAEISARYGHANAYADSFPEFASVAAQFKTLMNSGWQTKRTYPHEGFQSILPKGRSFYIPHHSNMDSWVEEKVVAPDGLPFWNAMPFPIPPDRQSLRLFEMCQTRGAFESEQPNKNWGVRYGGYGGSAQTALLRGYRIGFVGASDNHCGWPTRGTSGNLVGLTGVISAKLDQKSLFDALHARRCYATTGARIVADATLNDAPIGSELKIPAGGERKFRIAIRGTAPLADVQIISFGIVLANLPVDGKSWDYVGEWIDDRPGRTLHDVYYYVRARQSDGHCVWLSPWWVDLADEPDTAVQ